MENTNRVSNYVIHPSILWMMAVANQLVGSGVAIISDGGVLVQIGKLIKPPHSIKPGKSSDFVKTTQFNRRLMRNHWKEAGGGKKE